MYALGNGKNICKWIGGQGFLLLIFYSHMKVQGVGNESCCGYGGRVGGWRYYILSACFSLSLQCTEISK